MAPPLPATMLWATLSPSPIRKQYYYIYLRRTRSSRKRENTLNLTRTYTYDANSNLKSATDRNNRVRTFTYDNRDRLLQEQWLNAGTEVRTTTLDYDNASRLISAKDPDSTYTYTYDKANRLTSVKNIGTPGGVPFVVLTYTPDAVGNVLSVTDTINGQLTGTKTYSHDPLNASIG